VSAKTVKRAKREYQLYAIRLESNPYFVSFVRARKGVKPEVQGRVTCIFGDRTRTEYTVKGGILEEDIVCYDGFRRMAGLILKTGVLYPIQVSLKGE